MNQANVTVHDLDAIATTVKPGNNNYNFKYISDINRDLNMVTVVILALGLASCLLVGLKHGKNLSLEGNKPFIPVHHMKAHALTCRMFHDLQFPYLVLLVSGGHCLLTIARSIEDFDILGRYRNRN